MFMNLLLGLLGPMIMGMGVSEADLQSYAGKISGYVDAIGYLLIAAIVVMIAAHFVVKKGARHVVRWTAAVAWVAAAAIIVNLICFGPMKSNIAGALNAKKADFSADTVANSEAVIREVGEEGMVLLKNNGLLPLSDTSKLNVFGWDSTNPIFGGTGSGSSDAASCVGILQSFQDAGFETNEELSQMYVNYRADRPTVAMSAQDWTLPEPTVEYYTDELMNNAKSFSDTAVIVIGRSGGEGADLPTDMYAVIHGTWNVAPVYSVAPNNYGYTNGTYTNNGSYDDFDKGEHFLELSNTEEAMIEKVCSSFDKVIVVINANNAMELGWVDSYPQIGAVIYAPGTGKTGMAALGEIVSGTINPSGKTVDTFVTDLTATPTWNNFGNFAFSNVNDLKQKVASADAAYEGNMAFVNYVENIYVGYKFYETAAAVGMAGFNYDEAVQYPFGYGLSFTEFSQEIANFTDNGDSVSFDVNVTNTGSVAGKTAVEVYFTPPYTEGGIEKAAVNLVEFGKTGVIEPGASETVSFTIPKEDFASYDSEGIKTSGGYILEAGEYTISVRADSHTVLSEAKFTVEADIDYTAEGRPSDKIPANNRFTDYAKGNATYLSRAGAFANYAEATAKPASMEMSPETRTAVEANAVGIYDPTLYDNAEDVAPTLGASNGLKLADLSGKSYDDADWDKLLDQLSFDDMALMINLGGWQTAAIDSVGKVATSDCDGPAGLSNFITQVYGTAYPSEVLMAQTWSKELATKLGTGMGGEYAAADNFGWYGPAMNTHRNAFAGRNFEYYSEDGVLAGKFASNVVNAAAELGVYPYIKHFALNDQETNRCSYLLTYSTEQAIREIYLKPFELVVKNYDFSNKGLAVMSSFNWIGTRPSCANPDLLNTVLRGEWGFLGMVETDYDGSYGYMISDHCVRNGNDLMLGFAGAESNQFTDQSATALLAMRQSCKNILYTVGNSGYYANGDTSGGMDNMTKKFLTYDICIGVALVAIEAIVLTRYFKKKKNG